MNGRSLVMDKDFFETEAERAETLYDEDYTELMPEPDDDRPIWWSDDDYEYYDDLEDYDELNQ